MRRTDLRNIVIIAHVDHGKTTLVDCFLQAERPVPRQRARPGDCILDSNDLERERGITILAKNIALPYKGVKINIIDTPGHADFGGEVERVVRMADGAVVLVDAAEGPMPQTRFVLCKALEAGLRPIVVINKIDRPDARPHATLDEAFDLFVELGADEHLEDFQYLFASGREGYATSDPAVRTDSMQPLLDMVLEPIPGPEVDPDAPLQMLVTTLDWSEFVGRIAIGRITGRHRSRRARPIALMKAEGDRHRVARARSSYTFDKLGRVEVDEVDRRRRRARSSASKTSKSATRSATASITGRWSGCTSMSRRWKWSSRSTARRSPAARASTSPTASSASGCSRSWSGTSPCACGRSKAATRSPSPAAACCTCRC